jgi:hypothetical protein
MIHLKFLEKYKEAKPKNSKWKEIIKISGEINEIEAKKYKNLVLWKDKQDG